MATTSVKAQIRARDYAFSGWISFVLGFLLLEAGWMGTHRMVTIRLVVGVICCAGAALALKRYRVHTLALGEPPNSMLGARSLQVQLVCAVFVAALGYFFGKAILIGFFTPTFALGTAMTFIPWAKLSFSRWHLLSATTVLCSAVALVLLAAPQSTGGIPLAIGGLAVCFNGAVAIAFEAITRSAIRTAEKPASPLARTEVTATQ